MAPNHLARVDEQVISIRDMADLVAQIDTALQRACGFTLFTLNLDHLVKRRHDAAFRELYDRATFVTADGWPVVRLARRHDRSIERTAGADAVLPLCRLAARRRIPVAVFGSTQPVLDAAADRLRQLAPGLEVRFAEAPPFGFDPLGADGEAAMARLETSGAGLCFVALGAPKQELFADAAVRRGSAMGFACIGAGLDFIAGAQTRAPSLVQAFRLEWAWRLLGAPRRLGARYLRCAILYARLLATAGGPTGAAR